MDTLQELYEKLNVARNQSLARGKRYSHEEIMGKLRQKIGAKKRSYRLKR